VRHGRFSVNLDTLLVLHGRTDPKPALEHDRGSGYLFDDCADAIPLLTDMVGGEEIVADLKSPNFGFWDVASIPEST
jgi:hypothetical protein